MSDHTWEKAIDLVKFMGKRGAHMSFRYGREEIKERVLKYTYKKKPTYTLVYVYTCFFFQ